MAEPRKKRRVRITDSPRRGKPSFVWVVLCFLAPPAWPIGLLLIALRLRNEWRWKKHVDYSNYASVIGTEYEMPISEITSRMNKTREQAINDLQTMIRNGYMGESAYIDHARDVLVLDADEAREAAAARGEKQRVGWSFDVRNLGQNVRDAWARKKEADYRNYAAVIGSAHEMPISEIMAKTGKSRAQVMNDLQKMIQTGMLGDKAYIDHAREALVVVETRRKAEAAKSAEPVKSEKPAQEEKFEEILRKMRRLNDDIDDETVSRDIDRIGELTSNIFGILCAHPERRDEVRRFMDYYLPTTFSLLESYAMMEEQRYQSDNIVQSRKKIEDIMGKLVEAFEKQHDRMFQKDALDVDAEISVLETMLASDGLSCVPGADIHEEFERRRRQSV